MLRAVRENMHWVGMPRDRSLLRPCVRQRAASHLSTRSSHFGMQSVIGSCTALSYQSAPRVTRACMMALLGGGKGAKCAVA
jgi:hypothetical protein